MKINLSSIQGMSKNIHSTGLYSENYIQNLKRENTLQAKKILETVLAYNAVYKGAQNTNPDRIARELSYKFDINAEFGNNPLFASFAALAVNAFHKLGFVLPKNIFLKDLKGTSYNNFIGLCATYPSNAELYNKFRKDFPIGSVIMNADKNWNDRPSSITIQDELIELYRRKQNPYCHFMGPFLHEFFHNAHLDNLTKRFGNGSKIMHKFQKEFKNKSTIELIKKETGTYAATSPCEMFADEMTDLTMNSINPKTLLPNELIFQMQKIKEPFSMSKMIDACWSGDVSQIEAFRKNKNFIQKLCNKAFQG